MLGVLRALLVGLVDIILLRRGPDVLPTSTVLLALVIALHTAIYVLIASRMPDGVALWPLILGLSVVFTLGWYYVTLKRARKPERFTQTMTAMYGVNVLFLPVVMPLALEFMSRPKEQQATAGALALVILVVSIWDLVVSVHIVRAALEWPMLGALGLFVAQNLAWIVVSGALFGGLASP